MAKEKVVFSSDYHAETMWAERLADGNYRLNNTPILIDGISHSDVFSIKYVDGDDRPYYDRVVRRGPYQTFRIMLAENRPANSATAIEATLGKLKEVAFDWTRYGDECFVYAIRKDADTTELEKELDLGEDEGLWEWSVASPLPEDW